MGGAIECQPVQASSSSLGSWLLVITSSRSGRLLHGLPPGGQYLPAPYFPSSEAARRVSSAVLAGSLGAARVRLRLSRSISRRRSVGSATPSKRAAFLARSTPT